MNNSEHLYYRALDASRNVVNAKSFAMWDMALAVQSTVVFGWLNAIQEDIDKTGAEPLSNGSMTGILLNTVPLDWKGAAVAVGAFAITDAAQRVRNADKDTQTIQSDLNAFSQGVEILPFTRRQKIIKKLGRTASRTAITGAAMYGGYKIGEGLEATQALGTQVTLGAGAFVYAHTYGKLRDFKQSRRQRRMFNNAKPGDFIDVTPNEIPKETGPFPILTEAYVSQEDQKFYDAVRDFKESSE